MLIEEIVRPFVAPQLTSTGQIPVPSTTTGAPVVLKWGAAGKMPDIQGDGIAFNLCGEIENELSRTTTDVQYTDANDSSKFIVVQRVQTLKLSKAENRNVLSDPLTADIAADFSEFQADIASSFVPEDGSSNGSCGVTINLK
jgi:hypothetical protein